MDWVRKTEKLIKRAKSIFEVETAGMRNVGKVELNADVESELHSSITVSR